MSDAATKDMAVLLSRKYPTEVYFIEEEGGEGYYFACLPDFGSSTCSATGDSAEEALSRLSEVREAVIRHLVESGSPVPEPSRAPFECVELQQMPIRIPKDMHDQIKRAAKQSGLSLNAYVQRVLAEHLVLRTVEVKVQHLIAGWSPVPTGTPLISHSGRRFGRRYAPKRTITTR